MKTGTTYIKAQVQIKMSKPLIGQPVKMIVATRGIIMVRHRLMAINAMINQLTIAKINRIDVVA